MSKELYIVSSRIGPKSRTGVAHGQIQIFDDKERAVNFMNLSNKVYSGIEIFSLDRYTNDDNFCWSFDSRICN